jgi:lipopolysaccharide transport system permease protein
VWAVAIPVIQAVVLSIIFTRVVRIRTSIPYPLFILSGIVPWTFFSVTITASVRSITGGSAIASKVYFPRAVLPLTTVGTGIYGFVPSLIVMMGVALALGAGDPARWVVLLPASIVMVVLTSSLSLVLAALQVYFRDIAHILSAILMAWFYGSAVLFPVSFFGRGVLRTIILVNPATGMVELFRVAFMGLQPNSFPSVAATLAWTAVFLVIAGLLFRRFDRVFIDLL